ncbi:MAG: hypothetical protein AAF228_11810 [Pseudomonadota bacterium]
MGRPTEEPKTQQFQMRVSPDFLEKVDSWRRNQPDLPPRAEAIRRLVEQSLTGKTEEQLLRESLDLAEEEGGSFTADEVFPPLRTKFENRKPGAFAGKIKISKDFDQTPEKVMDLFESSQS